MEGVPTVLMSVRQEHIVDKVEQVLKQLHKNEKLHGAQRHCGDLLILGGGYLGGLPLFQPDLVATLITPPATSHINNSEKMLHFPIPVSRDDSLSIHQFCNCCCLDHGLIPQMMTE